MTVAADEPTHAHAHPFLQHHFEDLGQQHEASTLGMWMFLATEILFFGGVLLAYWVYRTLYPQAWALGAGLLSDCAAIVAQSRSRHSVRPA